MNVQVSSIICTRNRPDLIGQAVSSVLSNTYPNFDLVVVDQSDDDKTGRIVRLLMTQHLNLQYIHDTTPGLSRAYNTGVRASKGLILAFTDDDCVAGPDWIASIVAAFEGDAEADMLYGQVLRAPALFGVVGEVPELLFENPVRLSHWDGFRVFGMGANFGARRQLFDRVGGFDEILGGGGPLKSSQDFDFQYRVCRAGGTVLMSPTVKVDHYGLRNYEDQWPATLRAYGIGDGAFYFKHVRCGDLLAFGMLARKLVWIGSSEALSRLGLRRRRSRGVYWRSLFVGIWQSLRYPVERHQRMYRATAHV